MQISISTSRITIFFQLLFAFLSLLTFACKASPLPNDEVFQLQAKQLDSNNVLLYWQINPGYFLYKERIKISSKDSNITLGALQFPENLKKTASSGREFAIYKNKLELLVPILSDASGEYLLSVDYQGCSDAGFCYPPTTKQVKIIVNPNLELTSASLFTNLEANTQESKDSLAILFESHNWPFILLIFFGFGVLLAFTPCVLPMIPVLSGIIIGHGKNLTTRKAFFLSLSYVLAMAITYALAGAIVAVLGSNLQILMQSPWSISIFCIIFVLLALSMFGYFEFKLPLSWQNKIASITRTQASGHYFSAALMGALSILILSPCVTPPLIGALTYIANTGNIFLGSLSLFVLALGMGVPLILIGISAGAWVPKAGEWMNVVKAFFGVLLLAIAILLISRIISPHVSMVLWAILVIFTGIFMGALRASRTNLAKFKQALGLILLVYGIFILFGASMGSTNPLCPLENLSSTKAEAALNMQTVTTLTQLNTIIESSKGSSVILDFYADWCESCKLMETTIFKAAKVRDALNEFVLIKVDISANSKQSKALMQHYKVIAPPTFVFLNPEGKELGYLRLIGELTQEKLLDTLEKLRP